MYRIIVVDDEEITRNAIEKFIKAYFPELELLGSFLDGTDAFAFLENNPVDLVITDIRMPHMDGLELSKRIFEKLPNCIIFIISGYGEFEYARTAMKYGVSTYILKPFDFDELKSCLVQAIKNLDSLYVSIHELDFTTEDTELFFIDLIMGSLKQKNLLTNRFQSLELPFSLDRTPGLIIKLNLFKNDTLTHWKYGNEKIGTALNNALHMILQDIYIYPVFKTGSNYYFVAIFSSKAYPLDIINLHEQVLELLNFDCQVTFEYSFENLSEFAMNKMDEKDLPIKPHADNSNNDLVIQKAIDYINTHYAIDLTREDVADAVFLSSAYFSRFFKQKTGLSFFDYLTTVRMQKAIELLSTKMRINEIAKTVGYQSRNRFFINFRRYTSYNPTDYRKSILNMEDTHEEI